MAAIVCPHCGKIISSNLTHCTECGKPLDIVEGDEPQLPQKPKRKFEITPRRIVVLCFLAPFVLGFVYLFVADIRKARDLEDRAYQRLENSTDLLVYEDFIVRFPDSKRIEDVKERYEVMKQEHAMFFAEAAQGGKAELLAFIQAHPSSPYRAVCELRIDSLDWNAACEAHTLEAYQAYLAQHPQGVFLADATDVRNKLQRLVVTGEETSILRGAVDNFLSAMTAGDVARIDGMINGSITFCGIEDASGESIVAYYNQNIHKDDVIGVHFQLEGTSINKKSVAGSDALSYNLYSNAAATINRAAVDSAMVVNYRVSASFSPERRITSLSVTPVVEAVE